jgi:hypothetical protein
MIIVPRCPAPLKANARVGNTQRLNKMRFNQGFP